ncbi:hypothetical protein [Erwinia typographi]|uniref:hypothetical protein n=1 Tax=Erwinia typographi TaxID=371042 RepID=UPI0009079C29|nr:hypothetical protein [Erwinia typographi]
MKKWIIIMSIVMSGCTNHPLDCATGLVAWDDCLPGTVGYNIRQQSLKNLAAAVQEKNDKDDRQCRSYGAQPGTDSYVNCRVSLSNAK